MNGNERVSLQYSISLSELPTEVSRLINKVAGQVKECHNEMLPALVDMDDDSRLELKTCKALSNIRDTLAASVCVLDDVNNIIEGYVRHQTRPPEQATPQATAIDPSQAPTAHHLTDPLAMSGAMAELQKKLKLFQQPGMVENEEPTATERE